MARGWGLFAPTLSRVSFVCCYAPAGRAYCVPGGALFVCAVRRFRSWVLRLLCERKGMVRLWLVLRVCGVLTATV